MGVIMFVQSGGSSVVRYICPHTWKIEPITVIPVTILDFTGGICGR